MDKISAIVQRVSIGKKKSRKRLKKTSEKSNKSYKSIKERSFDAMPINDNSSMKFTPRPPSSPPTMEPKPPPIPAGYQPKEAAYVDLISTYEYSELLDPFSTASAKARYQAAGKGGIFGFLCINCREFIDEARKSKNLLIKCDNDEAISSRIVSSRVQPETTDQQWTFYVKNDLIHWTRTLTFEDEALLNKRANELEQLDEEELLAQLKERFMADEELPTYYPDERKKELVQYILAHELHSKLLDGRSFVSRVESRGLRYEPVGSFSFDPSQKIEYGETLDYEIDSNDLAIASKLPAEKRIQWLRQQLSALMFDDEYDGPLRVTVKREDLLEKAADWINALQKSDKWRKTRYEFEGEPAFDSGGVAKEWYRLVAESLFQSESGLFRRTSASNVSYDINPDSALLQPERHLFYFRFAGRLLAKALLEGCFIDAYLQNTIYKHLLRRPISYLDLKYVDEGLFNSMQYLLEQASDKDIEDMDLTFVKVKESFGAVTEIELKEGGSEIKVTRENLREYVGLLTKYHLYDQYEQQLGMVLLGFYEILPAELFMGFSDTEFETLVCGVSDIDIEDFKQNVDYIGAFEAEGENHETVKWFWDIVSNSFNEEEKQKLLQFITGSSRVPVGGFKAFEDGKNLKISIWGIKPEESVFPRAHTCFNRLDLPVSPSKSELKHRLQEAIEYVNGFNLE